MPGSTNQYPHDERPDMQALVPQSAGRVLDIGCHTGAFGEALKMARAVEVWGVEPNLDSAGRAGAVLDRVIAMPFTEAAPIPDGYFDVVTFNDSLEHMVDPWQALRLAARKIRDDGCVIASIPNLRHVENLLHILLEGDFRYEDTGIRDRTHLRFFTRTSGNRLFAESGLDVIQVQGIYKVWWTKSLLRRLAYRLFPRQLEDTKYRGFAFVARKRREPS